MKNVVLSLLVVTLSLVGCSKPDDAAEAPTTPESKEPVAVVPEPKEPVQSAVEVTEPVKPEVTPAPVETALVEAKPVPPPETTPVQPVIPEQDRPPMNRDAHKELATLTETFFASEEIQTDKSLKHVGSSVNRAVQTLGNTAVSDMALQKTLKDGVLALTKGDDSAALASISGVSTERMSDSQAQLVVDAQNALSAFIAERNFKELPQKLEVSQLVNALHYGDLKTALTAGQSVQGSGGLTTAQQEILNSILARVEKAQAK